MNNNTFLDKIHSAVIRNIWLQRFTVFNRVVLAAAFVPSGLKKIIGERFTQLPLDNPVGFFFEALYQTGFYYNFLGWMQVIAAILLLIPRTSTLGAVIFFPIVLNICLITISVGFRGTWVITSLMVLANLYLLCWDYDKLKFILPFGQKAGKPVKTSTYWLEVFAWGLMGAVIFFGLVSISVINLMNTGIAGAAATILAGVIFGLFAVWHRGKLTQEEK